MKRIIKNAARMLGWEIVRKGCGSSFLLLETLSEIFNERKIDLVLDVGANTGQFRDYLRKGVGYTGRIISFEPNPEAFRRAADRAANDHQWDVHNLALGAETSSLDLNIMRESVLSSFFDPNPDVIFPDLIVERKVPVQICRLDDILPELGVELADSRTYLKCDTQGFDLQVLNGGSRTISMLEGFQCEVSAIPIYEDSIDMLEAMAQMRSYGFDVAGLVPVVKRDGKIIEFDCIMISRRRDSKSA